MLLQIAIFRVQIHANLAQGWGLFKSILGSREMHWKCQNINCMDGHVEQDDRRKSGFKQQNSKTESGLEKMSMPSARKEFLKFWIEMPKAGQP